MPIHSEFAEALDVLMRHHESASTVKPEQLDQAIQKMHIIMTGGPASTPELASTTVQEMSAQLIGFLEALE